MPRWRVLYVLLVLFPNVSPVPVQGQQAFVRGSDVAFTIQAHGQRHEVGQPIVIRYTLTNVSNGALFVPKSQWDIRCGDPPHLWARLEDSSGKHYEAGYGGSCLGPSREERMSLSERMRKDAVLLKPGQSVSGSFRLELQVLGNLKPGSYRLEAVLYGWNRHFRDSELLELHGITSPFLIGEAHATTQIELHGASKP